MTSGYISFIHLYMLELENDPKENEEQIIQGRCIRMLMHFMYHSLQHKFISLAFGLTTL